MAQLETPILSLSDDTNLPDSFEVSWTPVSGSGDVVYELQSSDDGVFWGNVGLFTEGVDPRFYTFDELENHTEVFVRIRATDDQGFDDPSEWSDVLHVELDGESGPGGGEGPAAPPTVTFPDGAVFANPIVVQGDSYLHLIVPETFEAEWGDVITYQGTDYLVDGDVDLVWPNALSGSVRMKIIEVAEPGSV